MKTVFRNNAEACHKWASQSQSTGRAGNISFDSETIYSYAASIARFIAPEVVLFRDRSYSVTTSAHQSLARSAISHCRVFTVVSLRPKHQENIANYLDKVRKTADHFWNSTGWRAGGYQESYQRIVKETKDYAKYFNCQELILHLALFGLELSGNKAKAKLVGIAERERLYEEHKEAARLKSLEYFSKDEQRWIDGEKLDRWASTKIDGFTFYMQFNQCRLRYLKDKDQIETSMGAYVSAKAGRVLYKLIEAGRPVHGHKIDGYTVIGYNGSLKIGCHKIMRSEIDRIAAIMSW